MALAAIEEVIREMNALVEAGIVDSYAIGGAVGATFYLEPVATVDVDVFVAFKDLPGEQLIDPQPIFRHFASRGYSMDGEYVMIAGWPVQILASSGPLVDEALANAEMRTVSGVPARVFRAEDLAVMCLQTGRAKDKARLLQFIEEGALESEPFEELVRRHGLSEQWNRFRESFEV